MKKESAHSFLEKKIMESDKNKISIDSLDFGLKVNDDKLLKNIPTKPAIKIIENGITNFIRKDEFTNGYNNVENYLCFGVNSKNLEKDYFNGINRFNYADVIKNSMRMWIKKAPNIFVDRPDGWLETFTNLDDDPKVTDNLRVNSLDIKIDFQTEEENWFPGQEFDVKSKFREDYEDYKNESGSKVQNRRGSYSNNKSNKSAMNYYDKTRELVEAHNSDDFYEFYLKDNCHIPRNLKRIELTLIDTASYIKFGLLLPGQKNNLINIFNNVEQFGKDILIKGLDYYLIHGGENIVYEELSKVEKNVFDYLDKIVKAGESIEDRAGFERFSTDFLAAKNPNKNIISSYRKALRKIYHLYFPRVRLESKTKK